MNLINLPEDIFHLIADYLHPVDLLHLCSTSHILHDNDSIRLSSSYWSAITRNTFRVPHHPITEKDGRRWMQLYRRLRTQTKVYTWGNNDLGCLGGEIQMSGGVLPQPGRGGVRIGGRIRTRTAPANASWPKETRVGNMEAVADLQSGGWSTTALSSTGQLVTVGVIDGSDSWATMPSPVPHNLDYPEGFVSPRERYDAYTAIRQFSSGRSHVLGLSDAGRVWSWADIERPGLHIKFLHVDLVESQHGDISKQNGAVRKVVAGWSRSSAYINGTGIIVWEPSNNAEIQGDSDQSSGDGMLVLESWIVPGTSYIQPTNRPRFRSPMLKDKDKHVEIGEVTNWIVLEKYILFTTHTGHLYASLIPTSNTDTSDTAAHCLNPHFVPTSSTPTDAAFIQDIQGSFRSFAIFLHSGTVLLGDQDYLHSRLGTSNTADSTDRDTSTQQLGDSARKLRKIPALQNSGVIQLAFGDWHIHALHRDGTISSYGHEPDLCGALGLGSPGAHYARGCVQQDNYSDGMLCDEALTRGRRVWFEEEKLAWIEWCLGVGTDRGNRVARETLMRKEVRAEVSEWFEERLRGWEKDAPDRSGDEEGASNDAIVEDDDGLPAHFALSVAAAGWHSGALVLVNEAKAARVRNRYRARARDFAEAAEYQPNASVYKEWQDQGWLDRAMTWVLGLLNLGSSEQEAPLGVDGEKFDEAGVKNHEWVWQAIGETFPRLRLKSGEVMPGNVNIIELEDRIRVWKDVDMVDL